MKKFLHIFILAAPMSVFSQPVITDADNFTIGTTLRYMNCNEYTAYPGGAGANQTWSFPGLVYLMDTLTVKIGSPSSAPHGNQFPAATFVKELSTGDYLYFEHTASGNELYGLMSANSSYTIQMFYSNPEKSSETSITFGTTVIDTFVNNFTTAGFNFKGSGTAEISGDAYGTLVLPGRTFYNTLRVKLVHDEIDTLMQFGSLSSFYRVTYKWYDMNNRAPLFEIDSIYTNNSAIKTVKLLLDVPLTTGISDQETAPQLAFSPNPADKEITLDADAAGRVMICDRNGRVFTDRKLAEHERKISTAHLPNGVYTIRFESEKSRFVKKLVVLH